MRLIYTLMSAKALGVNSKISNTIISFWLFDSAAWIKVAKWVAYLFNAFDIVNVAQAAEQMLALGLGIT